MGKLMFNGINFTAGQPGPQGPAGPQGIQGIQGETGPQGPAGEGVPSGGTTGQVLAKASDTDYDTEWITPSGSGGSIPDGIFGVDKGAPNQFLYTGSNSKIGNGSQPSVITQSGYTLVPCPSSVKVTGGIGVETVERSSWTTISGDKIISNIPGLNNSENMSNYRLRNYKFQLMLSQDGSYQGFRDRVKIDLMDCISSSELEFPLGPIRKVETESSGNKSTGFFQASVRVTRDTGATLTIKTSDGTVLANCVGIKVKITYTLVGVSNNSGQVDLEAPFVNYNAQLCAVRCDK